MIARLVVALPAFSAACIAIDLPARANGAALQERRLTGEVAIETSRFISSGVAARGSVSYAPDGNVVIVRTVRGDVAKDGAWVEFWTAPTSERAASRPMRKVASLFTSGLSSGGGGAADDTSGALSPLVWKDDSSVCFLFSGSAGPRQVNCLNVTTGQVDRQTSAATDIQVFDIGRDGTIIYLAKAEPGIDRSNELLHNGLTVSPGTDGLAVADGILDGRSSLSSFWDSRWFIQRRGVAPILLKVAGREIDPMIPTMRPVAIAPDGLHALLMSPASAIPNDWDDYAENERDRGRFTNARLLPLSDEGRDVGEVYLIDTRSGAATPVERSPVFPGEASFSWSPDSMRFAVYGMRSRDGTAHRTCASPRRLVVFSIGSPGKDVSGSPCYGLSEISWSSNVSFRVSDVQSPSSSSYSEDSHGWQRTQNGARAARERAAYEVRQDQNTPPALWRISRGKAQKVLDPNPGIRASLGIGPTLTMSGLTNKSENWRAVVFLPPNYVVGRRIPLVIQTQYRAALTDEFTLYGWSEGGGLGPTLVSSYAARILADRGIAVAELQVDTTIPASTEGQAYQSGIEAIITELNRRNIIDPTKVGLSGFSRNGYFVEYTLTHSKFPFAAAVVNDNFDPSYLQSALTEWRLDADLVNGASSFNGGLARWLESAPGFNAERVEAPLLLIGQSLRPTAIILTHWEFFSRLRRLDKPVELFLMPDIDRYPSHSPQNPRQVLTVQAKTVDWFTFWLLGSEDPLPSKRNQYERWEQMRKMPR